MSKLIGVRVQLMSNTDLVSMHLVVATISSTKQRVGYSVLVETTENVTLPLLRHFHLLLYFVF